MNILDDFLMFDILFRSYIGFDGFDVSVCVCQFVNMYNPWCVKMAALSLIDRLKFLALQTQPTRQAFKKGWITLMNIIFHFLTDGRTYLWS